jgi:glycine cleavage system H protein
MREMDYPSDVKYTKKHEWVRVAGKEAVCGITSFAQHELGDIVFVELPEAGAKVAQHGPFGVVESVKAVSDLFSPVSGKVVRVNAELAGSPQLVNADPYGAGWMIAVEMAKASEPEELMDAAAYEAFVREEGH